MNLKSKKNQIKEVKMHIYVQNLNYVGKTLQLFTLDKFRNCQKCSVKEIESIRLKIILI